MAEQDSKLKTMRKKPRAFFMGAASVALAAVMAFGCVGCRKHDGDSSDNTNNPPSISDEPSQILPSTTVTGDKPALKDSLVLNPIEEDFENTFTYDYSATSAVGVYGEILDDSIQRKTPIVSDERDYFPLGFEVGANELRYPKYGSTMKSVIGDDKTAARNALINESSYLTAAGTSNAGGGGYNMMDADGKLYLYDSKTGEAVPTISKDGKTQRQLYKHTAADGLYLGNVDDDELAVKKEITMRPRGYNGYGVTGLYAPAGEVITVQMSDADMKATKGVVIHIGQALYNGQANNIWAGKGQMQRLPHLLNTMTVNEQTATYDEDSDTWTAYVGSFIGGPVYIRNEDVTFTATISGAVTYSHFILGSTTKEEFEETRKNSSAPYFDLEVWNYGVLHSGPKNYAANFSYEDLYKAAVLWEKVSAVTTTKSDQGIVFLYDPFVAAGAAVAFPGRRSVNCPLSWMPASLNYNAIVTSGSWGNFHEYHHNFQGYGVGNGGEVTNNGMTLVSYALFTKISSKRGIGSFGAQGLGGWNNYTSATWALEETLKIARPDENPSNGNQGLALYATLLHNFGADNYITAKVTQSGGQNYTAYMNAWQNATHNNMLYYFKDILQGTNIDESIVNTEYPMFVPVSCLYQTGRSYMYDGQKKYFNTMQPYVIPYGYDFNIDLGRYTAPGGQYASGSVVIPEGFTYKIKTVTKPAHGSIEIVDDLNLIYKPDKTDNNMRSGQIVVTLEIVKDDGAFKVDDVDLVLEFEQSHETNKSTLERTTYTYSADKMYTDAQTAYENGFAGYEGTPVKRDQSNPTQNCNTDIWFYPDNEANREKYPDVPESYFVHDNTIEVVEGKLFVESDGKYRIYLRGRMNCALYYSLDGNNFTLGATIKDTTAPKDSAYFRNDENTYFDLEFEDLDSKGGQWIYLREVLIVQSSPMVSYIGVGMRQWTEPQYTMVEKYYDANGNEVAEGSENAVSSKTFYYDNSGKEVPEDVVAAAEKVPPVINKNNQPYVNAYRNSYEFPDNSEFESDFFYVRSYNYNYVGETEEFSTWDNGVTLVESNFVAESAPYTIENLFKEGMDTFIHPAKNKGSGVYITLDMGKTIGANSITFIGRTGATTTAWQGLPKEFKLEISDDGVNFVDAGTYTNPTGAANSATVKFAKSLSFRYIKITVNSTHSNTGRLILSGIKFAYTFTLTGNGSNHIAPSNENIIFEGNWETATAVSCFGHVYLGQSGSKIHFNFSGTRLAILTSKAYKTNFEVYVDGKKVDSINVVDSGNLFGISYVSEKLESGSHRVEIRCTGEANFDSFAFYNEA